MAELMIIGAGPAGVSAALYAKRANIETEVISLKKSSLLKAEKIANYYGVNLAGAELFQKGLTQLETLRIPLHTEEVLNLEWDGKFRIQTNRNNYDAKAVILATGAYRNLPSIKNARLYEGKGLSYCAICDGFFYRGKNVAVLGNGAYALHEAEYLKHLVAELYLLTNGKKIEDAGLNNYRVYNEKIKAIKGIDKVEGILFEDGSTLALDGLFVAEGVAGSVDLARKMGVIITENNKIATDGAMMTNIPGLFAAGDATAGMMQIVKAVYEGALAANGAIKFLQNKQ